ncbi:hypothetical protein EVAR_34319_1 [Eumeta japonica]|uniref:Uncharacterized protein n=1 Tax=Eumeta variegata TaxID=151549 RepID=A0A4C1VCR8_EUMVA|nr:hypothetical protein EVAR_34319_1 [Eumeta japonica]
MYFTSHATYWKGQNNVCRVSGPDLQSDLRTATDSDGSRFLVSAFDSVPRPAYNYDSVSGQVSDLDEYGITVSIAALAGWSSALPSKISSRNSPIRRRRGGIDQ